MTLVKTDDMFLLLSQDSLLQGALKFHLDREDKPCLYQQTGYLRVGLSTPPHPTQNTSLGFPTFTFFPVWKEFQVAGWLNKGCIVTLSLPPLLNAGLKVDWTALDIRPKTYTKGWIYIYIYISSALVRVLQRNRTSGRWSIHRLIDR